MTDLMMLASVPALPALTLCRAFPDRGFTFEKSDQHEPFITGTNGALSSFHHVPTAWFAGPLEPVMLSKDALDVLEPAARRCSVNARLVVRGKVVAICDDPEGKINSDSIEWIGAHLNPFRHAAPPDDPAFPECPVPILASAFRKTVTLATVRQSSYALPARLIGTYSTPMDSLGVRPATQALLAKLAAATGVPPKRMILTHQALPGNGLMMTSVSGDESWFAIWVAERGSAWSGCPHWARCTPF